VLARASSVVASVLALAACAPRPAMCGRTCDDGFACVAGECLRRGAVPEVEALDKFGLYQTRRLVLPPVEIARLGPGDSRATVPRVAILARRRDAASVLLLRFEVDLPPGTTIVEAHLVLDRAPTVDADPAPIVLRAARIVDPWAAGSLSWGRAPRLEDARLAATTIDDARRTVRLDVRPLVRRWRLHAPDDQGIAVVADRSSATGMGFAVAEGVGSGDDAPLASPVHAPGPPPLFAFEGAEGSAGPALARSSRGPRLELYVKP
jgi:hypothetical protein